MRVSILGAGGWGTTLAILLSERNNDVTLWEYFPDYAKVLGKKRENIKFLKGVKIPRKIKITNKLDEAVEGSGIIVIAVPSHTTRALYSKIKKLNYRKKVFVIAAKGIERKTLLTMSGVIKEMLGGVKHAVISGPSHAEEVARKVPTTVAVASDDYGLAEKIQEMFFTNYFRVYANSDVTGVELGGGLKNVIAIAAGIIDGLGAGDNTKAALITRGLAEIRRLGVKMGAAGGTFSGLSGMGDLIVTCASKHSRNRRVGEMLGKGKKLNEILAKMEMVAEGVKTAESAYRLSKKHRIDMPITTEVYRVLYRDKSPYDSIRDLMKRSLKSEKEFLGSKGKERKKAK